MKNINLDPNNLSRFRTLKLFEKPQRQLLKQIRTDRNYQIPKGYITWHELSAIAGIALSTCQLEYAKTDLSAFLHSHRMALWFCQDAPLYCISQELFQAFDNTDALHKPEVFAGWKPSLPTFLVALPSGVLRSPSGEIDYLCIHSSTDEHPEWESAHWKNIKVPVISGNGLTFDWSTTDKKETVWLSNTAVSSSGELIHNDNNSLGRNKIDQIDRVFLERVRNIVINILLSLEYSPEFISDVAEENLQVQPKGFGVPKQKNNSSSNIRHARWLGKNYQNKRENNNSRTHASPYTHWRRGHWRVIESGEGKRWKKSRRMWIQPVLVNG
ncbi:hypothetical protein [Cylindrospermum sp. FACHB-282]|uniref:hypothetical protein n=1 Tax=Cylindrospermum sp. FACHB-282 TaxID=2692794 RepID=UPI0016889535|nr:hypothetical protein [Cylindrospermum sp. FACHB-282]MBD2385994.1 hypothetical protein [Cylindrospermum sp. FACHB-282]